MSLAPGTAVTVTISGQAKGLLTKDDILSGVVAELQSIPLFVTGSAIDAGNTLYNAATFQWFHYDYRATITVTVPADYYDAVTEVGDDVAQAFEDIAGSTPTAVQALPSRAGSIPAPAGSNMLPDLAGAVQGDIVLVVVVVAVLAGLLIWTVGPGVRVAA